MQQHHFTAVYFLLILLAWNTRGQSNGCLSLEGSKACPAYSQYHIPLAETGDRYPFLSHVTDLDSFDQALYSYAKSSDHYKSQLGCHNVQSVPYARYSLTRLCAMVIYDMYYSESRCDVDHAVAPAPPLCQVTCYAWIDSIQSLTIDRCFNGLSGSSSTYFNLMEECSILTKFNGTGDDCVSGEQNEPKNCGFQSNTASACQYCRYYNQTDRCCDDVRCDALSGGDIAGIVVGSVVGSGIIGLAVFCLCSMRRRVLSRRKSGNNQFQFKTYHAAPLVEEHDDKHDSRIPLTMNNDDDDTTTQHTTTTTTFANAPKETMDHTEIPSTAAASMTPPLSPPQQPRPEDLYLVIYPYPPQMGDELALHEGDLICLAVSFDDGWAIGFNVMTGLKGAFPLVCVSPAPLDLMMDASNNDNDHDHDDDITSERMMTHPNQLKLLNVEHIREKVRRSMSLGNSPPTMTQHRHIPRRTASMRNTHLYSTDSPTSPNSPFFDTKADVVPLSKAVVRSPSQDIVSL